MKSITRIIFVVLSYLASAALVACTILSGAENAVSTLTSFLPLVENAAGSSTEPSVLGLCSSFSTVTNITIDDVVGDYFLVRTTFPCGEATTTCSTMSLKPSLGLDNVANINITLTGYSNNHDNPRVERILWTEPIEGRAEIADAADVTATVSIAFVAFDRNVGFIAALCPLSLPCGSCETFGLNVVVKNRNATPAQINGLIHQLDSRYVPYGNLMSVNQTNCPPTPSDSLISVLPILGL